MNSLSFTAGSGAANIWMWGCIVGLAKALDKSPRLALANATAMKTRIPAISATPAIIARADFPTVYGNIEFEMTK
jgi:hypothetical protein